MEAVGGQPAADGGTDVADAAGDQRVADARCRSRELSPTLPCAPLSAIEDASTLIERLSKLDGLTIPAPWCHSATCRSPRNGFKDVTGKAGFTPAV